MVTIQQSFLAVTNPVKVTIEANLKKLFVSYPLAGWNKK